jgi:hypothetical protein
MASTSQLTHPPFASSIDEARALVRQCAEPRKPGELVKKAIFRASRRLEMPVSRTREIWYGDARRIDAEEMDRLRREAANAELDQTAAAIELLLSRILTLDSIQAIANLQSTLLTLQRYFVEEVASST